MTEQEVIEALESLEKKGYVKSHKDPNGKRKWSITQKGLDHVNEIPFYIK